MRILMLSWEYPPHMVGGLGKHVADLVPALAGEGVEVYVLTPWLRNGPEHETLACGATVWRVAPSPMHDYDYPTFVAHLNHTMERAAHALIDQVGSFDLIHAHDWLTAALGISLKHQWRIPLIATIHATERGRGQGYLNGSHARTIHDLEWELTYEAWQVIVCSAFMADQLQAHFSTPADKIAVVPNGVQLHPSPFHSAEERQAFRRRFAADDERIAFYVGRVVYEKGLHVLLACWPQVLERVRGTLVIAGVGPFLDDLKAQAVSLGIEQRVTFTGFISDEDRDRLYHIADVAVFPSLYEPFGIVALEAFAAGCPTVVSNTGGLAEVVRLHETGIIVYPGNPDSLAWGILHTLLRPDWSQQRAANALHEIQLSYTWQRIASETAAVYQRVRAAWEASPWGKEIVVQHHR